MNWGYYLGVMGVLVIGLVCGAALAFGAMVLGSWLDERAKQPSGVLYRGYELLSYETHCLVFKPGDTEAVASLSDKWKAMEYVDHKLSVKGMQNG